jgi:hypothetical protein
MGCFHLDVRCNGQACSENAKVIEAQSLACAREESVELALSLARDLEPTSEVIVYVREESETGIVARVLAERGRVGVSFVLRFR